MKTILLVGLDQPLLQTRAAVLRRTGAITMCASALEGLPMQERHRADLIVLCHTLPEPLRVTMERIVRERWPATRTLMVLNHEEQIHLVPDCADAVSSSQPERLLRRAKELLCEGGRAPVQISDWSGTQYVN